MSFHIHPTPVCALRLDAMKADGLDAAGLIQNQCPFRFIINSEIKDYMVSFKDGHIGEVKEKGTAVEQGDAKAIKQYLVDFFKPKSRS